MDLEALVDKLYEIRDLLELAQADHPEDYNLTEIHSTVVQTIEELE